MFFTTLSIKSIYRTSTVIQLTKKIIVKYEQNSQNLLVPNFEKHSSTTKSVIMSNLRSDSEDDNISTGDEEISSPARKLHKTSQTNMNKHVTPLASPGCRVDTCGKEVKKDGGYVEQKDKDKHVLCMFPFTGVQGIFRQEVRRLKNDPRGYFPHSDLFMPDNYCPHCCCPKPKCHDFRFGLYCCLCVAEDVKQYGINKMHTEKVTSCAGVRSPRYTQ